MSEISVSIKWNSFKDKHLPHGGFEKKTIFKQFLSAHIIDKGKFRTRKTLESWHTAITSDADNNAKQLPRQHSILL